MSNELLITLAIVATLLVLVGLVALRTLTKGKAEVRLTDAAIAIIPIVIVMLATGKITKLGIGTEGVTVETAREAILSASRSDVKLEIDQINPQRLQSASKGGLSDIPRLVSGGVQALKFTIGGANYVPRVMKQYFDELSKTPRFKYMVLERGNGEFFGILDARKLRYLLDNGGAAPFRNWNDVRDAIARRSNNFQRFPGFVGANRALTTETSKRVALERLQKEGREWLPVIGQDAKLAGITDRSRLTAGLILDVAK
jgi:hypothetical protein